MRPGFSFSTKDHEGVLRRLGKNVCYCDQGLLTKRTSRCPVPLGEKRALRFDADSAESKLKPTWRTSHESPS